MKTTPDNYCKSQGKPSAALARIRQLLETNNIVDWATVCSACEEYSKYTLRRYLYDMTRAGEIYQRGRFLSTAVWSLKPFAAPAPVAPISTPEPTINWTDNAAPLTDRYAAFRETINTTPRDVSDMQRFTMRGVKE
jgi:hypothetical protein